MKDPYSPTQRTKYYIGNMFDNGQDAEYETWEEFFEAAKSGSAYWLEDDWGFYGMDDGNMEKIRALTDRGFREERELFFARKGELWGQ
jgi:hypothetical protein